MTEPELPAEPAPRHSGRGRGTHAAPPSPLRLLVRSLLAVAVVAGAVALLLQLRGSSPTTSTEAPPGPAVVTSPTPTATPSPTLSPTPKQVISPTAGPTTTRPSPKPTRVVAPLLVLNNTREVGKAHRAAAKFRAGGWPVSGTGNYRTRRLSNTTVFYTPGNARELAAAQTLHRQYPAVRTVAPRFAGLPGRGLTVVLTADFPA